jgi:hypothetical protein
MPNYLFHKARICLIGIFLTYILVSLTTVAKGIARYQSTPPTNLLILHNRPLIAEVVKVNPEKILCLENGGYYVKRIHNNRLAITADNLREELDTAISSIDVESLKITNYT